MGLGNFIASLSYSTGVVVEPPQPVANVGEIIGCQLSLSNKFVDVYFDRPIYGESLAALTTSDFQITDLVAGGVTVVSIASVKKPNHIASGSATNLAGGESVIRFFLTLTGTADGTESFRIRPVADSVYDASGNIMSASKNTGTINLNIAPFTLWDFEEVSAVTSTGLGISTATDLMGNVNLTQGTDADRPLHYRQSSAQFVAASTEWLSAAANANFAKQQANNFSLVIKGLRVDAGGTAQLPFAYFHGTNNNGWFLTVGASNELRFTMLDNTTTKRATLPNFEDQEGTFFFINEGGTLSIYDENNNRVGTQGTTNISTITYTGVSLFVGRRETVGNYFNGEMSKIAFYNQALSSAQRVKVLENMKTKIIPTAATMTRYLHPVLSASINPSAADTIACFLGDVVFKDGTYYLYYGGGDSPADIDRGFTATKTNTNPDAPFTKVLDAGLPEITLAESGVNGTYDENEIAPRCAFWDEGENEFKLYFISNQVGASPAYTIGLATSADGINYTKQGQVYTDGTKDIITLNVCKAGSGDYRAIVVTSIAGGGFTNNYNYDYATSADGITWTKVGAIDSHFKNIIIISNLLKIGDTFYVVAFNDNTDADPANGNQIVFYTTTDFSSFVYGGVLLKKNEPGERGIRYPAFVQRAGRIEMFYTYGKNQNKTASNGGEAIFGIKCAVLNSTTLQQATVVDVYPSWLKKYWPLNPESATGNAFSEMIDGDTANFSSPSWSLDGLNFFDFLGTGITFPNNGLIFSPTDFALKLRVEIVTSGTINLFSCGTDIVVQLVSGNLRVALNNATKDYITTADIAKPTGINDSGNHVDVGFIWQGGVLKLCVGNTIDIAVTKTVDGAMTNIADSGSDVLLCSGATIEARSFKAMSGQTDQQWLDTDL